MRRFIARLLNLLRMTRPEDDLAREIDAHVALMQDDYIARGMSRDAARRAARVSLGGIEQAKELHREARSFVWLEDARRDVAHGLRLLRRSPMFTLTAALSLAIGIGANTAIFAVANSLLFRPPDGIIEPDRLVDLGTARGDGGLNPLSYSTYLELARSATSFSGVFASDMFSHVMSLSRPDVPTPEPVVGQYVSANFFSVLGARSSAGRVFMDGDGQAGGVAVLDHLFWIRRFNRDPEVVGRAIRINGRPFVVVGVAARDFRGAGMQTRDIWLVIGPEEQRSSVVAGGRLRPDVSVAAASDEVAAIGEALARRRGGTPPGQRLRALPFSRAGGNRNVVVGFSVALIAIVSLVLAAACANVAGILLARSMARSREMALRTALGAGRGRLVRQLLTETLLLFFLGGVLGVSLARGLVVIAPVVAALPIPVSFPVTLDLRVLSFAVALSLVAALISGLVPAFRDSKSAPARSLKQGSPTESGRSGLRGALVVVQTALSVLLIVLAGLFVRAVRYAGMTNPGFDPHGVEVAALDLSQTEADETTQALFWRNVIERVRGLSSVETASVALVPPGGFEGYGLGSVTAADAPATESFAPAWNLVDSAYFATLRIPILRGRDFSAGDVAGAPPVAIVADTIARRFWPGQAPVGKSVIVSELNPRTRQSETRRAEIVGVVGDIKSSSLIDGLAESYVYLPLSQRPMSAAPFTAKASIVARRRASQPLAGDIAAIVRELDPRLVIVRSETLEDSVALGLAPQRLLAAVAGSLGIVGLLLASIGVYGVIAYTVAQRRREFGIRMALGAQRIEIVGMVLGQGLLLVGVGAVMGLAMSLGAGEVLSVFLYGLPAIHLPTFLGTAALFLIVGSAACSFPVRHAIGIEPLRALRDE